MAQKSSKNINKNTIESELFSKSNIICISTMSKFILHTFHYWKNHNHERAISITNELDNDNGNYDKGCHFKFINYLNMKMPRKINRAITNLTRKTNIDNNKSSTNKQCKDSKGHGLNDASATKIKILSRSCSMCLHVASGKKLHGDNKVKTMKKKGMKIKRVIKLKGENRFELCKMKILMGVKCRPLNGTLRYDQNGVLIPEDL